MKKKLILLITVIFVTFAFTQISFEIIIGFGNVPTFSLDNLPDYSVVIYVGEPFVDVYIDSLFAGKTDAFGRLVVQFSSEGYHVVWVVSSNEFINYEKVIFKVEKKPSYVYVRNTGLGKLTVFSNAYPVYVYLPDGKGAGIIEKYGDSLLLPVGNYKVRLSSPGYESVESQVNILFKKDNPLWVEFKPLPFNLELIVKPEIFSPNGDWKDDECYIKIYSSRKADGVLQISDFSGKIVYERKISVQPGTTEIKWDGGGNKDGTYTVTVLLSDGISKIERKVNVIIDTTTYTYTKEITLTILGLFLALMGYLIYTTVNQ
ncbi:MAG: hypothetical protein ACP5PP_01425 [Fervidobacterium sp.]